MIITTPEELRLFSPSNAVDNIESLTGFINSSEQDFLRDKLGNALYGSLVAYYNSSIRDDVGSYLEMIQSGRELPAYIQLLYLCQKAVTYDALSRAVSLQAVSINGMGVNVAATDNYKAADREAIADFKKGCVKEAHSAVNALLQTLESWAIAVTQIRKEETESPDESAKDIAQETEDNIEYSEEDEPIDNNDSDYEEDTENTEGTEKESLKQEKEIVSLWKISRYFYLVTTLLIPSAVVLQEYYNIYESREKYIQMVPDLRYVQEDIIEPVFGEDFVRFLAALPWQKATIPDRHTLHIVHNLRKIIARYLEVRQTKSSDERHTDARNEAVKLTNRLMEYLQIHQQDLNDELLEVFSRSPLYLDPSDSDTEKDCTTPLFENNSRDAVMFVTPGLI